jgi:hypothetical protein
MGMLSVSGVVNGGLHDFGAVARNTQVSRQFSLRNVGDTDLSLDTLEITGAGFAIDPGDDPSKAVLPPAGSATVTVTGLFATYGAKTGQLTIPSDDAASPYLINLAATIPAPPAASGRHSRNLRQSRGRR